MFIITLEVQFNIIHNNSDIKGINVFHHAFLYTGYADYSTFFRNDIDSIKKLMSCFELFSLFSGLKIHLNVKSPE